MRNLQEPPCPTCGQYPQIPDCVVEPDWDALDWDLTIPQVELIKRIVTPYLARSSVEKEETLK